MLREVQSISKSRLTSLVVCLISAATLGGCATATDKAEKRLRVGEPVAETFLAPYEDVETAIKQAMIKYPQRIDNTEAGIFETDHVKGESRFKPAHSSEELSNGYRYRIIIRLVRGKKDAKSAVRVSVLKQVQLIRDFFANPDELASDGLEEKSILYRIGRELQVARALTRANERDQKAVVEE